MRAVPAGVELDALSEALRTGWGLSAESLDYLPVGGGSYHWQSTDSVGGRHFVTVDDLDSKLWLGEDRDSVALGLERAFLTAHSVKRSGLDFAVAPLPTLDGQVLSRLGPRYTVAVFPFIVAEPGQFGQYTASQREAMLRMLAELHQFTPRPQLHVNVAGYLLPERHQLETALQDRGAAWTAGPLSEPARDAIVMHASQLRELIDQMDAWAERLAKADDSWVITHGEPHAGNQLGAGGQSWLIDWDTVALGPPERDLWMLARDGGDTAGYGELTGYTPDPDRLRYFGVLWDLKDIAAFVNTLRMPHRLDADTEKALDGLTHLVRVRSGLEPG